MTVLAPPPRSDAEPPGHREPSGLLALLTTTDHKRIGVAYMLTAYAFFLVGGALAGIIRLELAQSGNQIVEYDVYNQFFTMHGSIMLFLFIGPFAFGLANYFVPIQVGANDMAFPRVNALSFWVFVMGGITMLAGFLTAGGAADFGWTGYTPLSSIVRSPGVGADLWLLSLVLTGLSGILTAVNVIATVVSMRAPGMTMFRMPIFTWNMTVVSVLVLIAFPLLSAAGAMLFADRQFDALIFDPEAGGQPILWQHLFWFFGHPEVYIVVLPYFGIVTEVVAVSSRRPVFGYAGLVFATIAIAALSVGVWAHHMFATGAVNLPFFTGLSMLIAVPTGVKFFNWVGTMWGGQIRFTTPMLFVCGFLFTFLLGGLTGVLLASAPIDLHVTDTYFVVAHMHYVLFGGSVFALYAGVYHWFPKITGRMLARGLGLVHFWMTLVGFHVTFLIQHLLGLQGMPRRIPDYPDHNGFEWMNLLSSVGTLILAVSTFPFLWNAWRSWRRGEPAGRNPWDGHTLEWATPSPPPAGNFDKPLPPIASNRPVWDQNHPEHTASGHL